MGNSVFGVDLRDVFYWQVDSSRSLLLKVLSLESPSEINQREKRAAERLNGQAASIDELKGLHNQGVSTGEVSSKEAVIGNVTERVDCKWSY